MMKRRVATAAAAATIGMSLAVAGAAVLATPAQAASYGFTAGWTTTGDCSAAGALAQIYAGGNAVTTVAAPGKLTVSWSSASPSGDLSVITHAYAGAADDFCRLVIGSGFVTRDGQGAINFFDAVSAGGATGQLYATQFKDAVVPTVDPTTEVPTVDPTVDPTTEAPTVEPTETPTVDPTTEVPTVEPTTEVPTVDPTTDTPTVEPTTEVPTVDPTVDPTAETPTVDPTTETPIVEPTETLPTDPSGVVEPTTETSTEAPVTESSEPTGVVAPTSTTAPSDDPQGTAGPGATEIAPSDDIAVGGATQTRSPQVSGSVQATNEVADETQNPKTQAEATSPKTASDLASTGANSALVVVAIGAIAAVAAGLIVMAAVRRRAS